MTSKIIPAVSDLLTRASNVDGRPALSDHLRLDLMQGGGDGFAGFVVSQPAAGDRTAPGDVIAYGQLSRGRDRSLFEYVVEPSHRGNDAEYGTQLLSSALDVLASDGGGLVDWWVAEPTELHRQLAATSAMHESRTLFQMRRRLPTGLDVRIETRAFVPGVDDERWLQVNNRAFADHGEQGGWTIDTLRQRFAEPWFDADGFRIHDVDGRIAGFCWTKVHEPASAADDEVGEIYVIAVDPDFHGMGLGKQLTLAGLEHLSSVGITSALLYVDAGNTAAVGLYERIGFTVSATNAAFSVDVPASGVPSSEVPASEVPASGVPSSAPTSELPRSSGAS